MALSRYHTYCKAPASKLNNILFEVDYAYDKATYLKKFFLMYQGIKLFIEQPVVTLLHHYMTG